MVPAAESQPISLTDFERLDWLRLARSENIGPRTFGALIERHGSAAAALEALPELAKQGKTRRPIRIFSVEEAEQELEAMAAAGAALIGLCEPDYPALLRRIASPPPLLAVHGNLTSLRRAKIGIVGSRNASAAGLAFTEQLARGLARAGYAIVSGLARGIDARAHQATIATGTIAVVASGLGAIYPAEHMGLVERLIEQGAVISEMPFFWEPRGRDFPRRNRIVSGLSQGVVVVEAARGSGSLWTARFALEQGRDVFAVPGSPLDPRAEGTNDLLRDGATFCTKAEDVIEVVAKRDLLHETPRLGFSEAGLLEDIYEPLWEEVNLDEPGKEQLAPPVFGAAGGRPFPIEETEAQPMSGSTDALAEKPAERSLAELMLILTELLGPTPISVDELARAARAQAREVRTALTNLHLAGRLEWHGGDLVSLLTRSQA